ncbi:radical SAM protein [Methanococcoides orientis]|uniref:radical SAM protein n=1 Tax=Methanococcoides orientis TaxID=2822137 RepID=UPI001E415315|nr:radical SAM protein [Methanococcoides orientis]UGV41463.1 radical SAM protein [Methanococcoides orientis]
MDLNEIITRSSKSVCPECLKVIDCQMILHENKVFLLKNCDEHGSFETLVYSDAKAYLDALKSNKPSSKPLHYQSPVSKGCPLDCGLCADHQQHTCVGIVEITDTCNLNCPVCFADSRGNFTLPFEKVKEMIDLYVKCEKEPEVLQISGGEPTLHPDILRILEYMGQKNIIYPVLNTNGLKLADMDFAEKIASTVQNDGSGIGKPVIYFQFDGLDDKTYTTLRGRPLLDIKMKALENCEKLGLTVALVATIVKGVNDQEIGHIIDLALRKTNIKMVNFQPATITGRYELEKKTETRLTIPEILDEIEDQTGGVLNKDNFISIPCPHPTCSVCAYVYDHMGKKVSLTKFLNSSACRDLLVDRTVADFKVVSKIERSINTLNVLMSKTNKCCGDGTQKCNCTLFPGMVSDAGKMIDNITLISVHAFMDEYNFDLERSKKCCITEILPNGQMIPFCVYNILYREKLTSEFRSMCQ